MKVSWVGIYDRGKIASERAHFRATVDFDLQFVVVLDSERTLKLPPPAPPSPLEGLLLPPVASPDTVQAGNKDCFWFPALRVKTGENVVLYTRGGTANTETRADGQVYHFFFRGLTTPKYPLLTHCAVLFEVNSWETSL